MRQAIIAALEPERALRERAERLRYFAFVCHRGQNTPINQFDPSWDAEDEVFEKLHSGDLADDLTATSSAHEGRETE